MKVVNIQNLHFAYSGFAEVLNIPNFVVERGQHCFLEGPSGSGKSTLLQLVSGILSPTQGSIEVLGYDLAKLKASQRDQLRGAMIGYIFQQFNLIPYLSGAQNIRIAAQMNPARQKSLKVPLDQELKSLALRLGIDSILSQKVDQMSVGQQQRVAAARALVGGPPLIIADEPTSALDTQHRDAFVEVLFSEAERCRATIIFVSHDLSLGRFFPLKRSLNEINTLAKGSQDAGV